jgi:RHS repeat-associated protein
MTYPSGRVVTHSYADSGGIASDRTDTLVDSTTSTTLVNSVTDNAAGAITARTLGGTITETRSFNSRNQLTGIAADTSSGTLMNIEYGYGANNDGRIRSRTDAVQPEHSASYTFDEIGRLTAVSGGDSSWGISWALDRYGNRQSQTPSGLASGRVGTQTTASYTNNKFSGFTYDAAGNLTDDGPNTYTYDAENRLIQINSSENQYAYDYAGRRVKRTTGGVTTYYFYGLTGLTSEFSTETGVTGAASTNRLQFRVGEQTGTSVMLTDSGGVPRENNRVFPFGEPWLALAGSTNNEKFTTYQHDNDAGTDLDYAMARYYASRSGRFMTPDPEHIGANIGDPQSWNAYTYAFVDPINFTDPTGLCPPETDDKSDCPKSLLAQLLTGIVGGKWGAGSPSTLGSCFDVETLGECVAQMLKMASKEAGQNTAKVSAPAVTRQGTTTPRAPTRGLLGVAPWQGSIFLPFRGKFGFGLEVNATYLPKSNEVCLGGGLGAGGFGLSGGPLVSGNTKSPEKVVMGASLGVAVQLTPFRGAQGIVNSSGALAGPTVGTSPGVSVTYTYTPESLCVDVPSW